MMGTLLSTIQVVLVVCAFEPSLSTTFNQPNRHLNVHRHLLQDLQQLLQPRLRTSLVQACTAMSTCLTASSDGFPDVELLQEPALGFIDTASGVVNQDINSNSQVKAYQNDWYTDSNAHLRSCRALEPNNSTLLWGAGASTAVS